MVDTQVADKDSSGNPEGSTFGASLGSSCVRGVLSSPDGTILDSGTRSFSTDGDELETAVGETLAIAEFYGVENPVLVVADADATDPERFDGVRLVGEVPAVLAAAQATSILEAATVALIVDVGRTGTRVFTLDTATGEMISGESTDHFSGSVCDDIVVDHLRAMYAVEPVSDADLAQLVVDASDAKLWLTDQQSVDVSGPFISGSVRLRRNVFEALIAPALAVVSGMVTTALSQKAVDAVLVIGGGANIAAVPRAIMAVTELPVLTPPQPEMFTAVGAAALWAEPTASVPGAVPAPVSAAQPAAPVTNPPTPATPPSPPQYPVRPVPAVPVAQSAPPLSAAVPPLVSGAGASATDIPTWRGVRPVPAAPAAPTPPAPTPPAPTPPAQSGRPRPAAKRVVAAQAAAAAAATVAAGRSDAATPSEGATPASAVVGATAPDVSAAPLESSSPATVVPPSDTADISTAVTPVEPTAAAPQDSATTVIPAVAAAPVPPADQPPVPPPGGDGGESGLFTGRVRVAVASLVALVVGVLAVAIALASQPTSVQGDQPPITPTPPPVTTTTRVPVSSPTPPPTSPAPVLPATTAPVTSTTETVPTVTNPQVTPTPPRVVPPPRVTTTTRPPIVTTTTTAPVGPAPTTRPRNSTPRTTVPPVTTTVDPTDTPTTTADPPAAP